MTNAEPPAERESIRNSCFVILSTFVIRISSFSRAFSRWLLQTYERPPLRLPPTGEEPRLHRCGGVHARARYRCHNRDFQRRLCRRVAPAAVPGVRAAGGNLDPNPAGGPASDG